MNKINNFENYLQTLNCPSLEKSNNSLILKSEAKTFQDAKKDLPRFLTANSKTIKINDFKRNEFAIKLFNSPDKKSSIKTDSFVNRSKSNCGAKVNILRKRFSFGGKPSKPFKIPRTLSRQPLKSIENTNLNEDHLNVSNENVLNSEDKLKQSKINNLYFNLSKHQRIIYDQVMSGENVFFTGCAGTGKSVLLNAIYDKFKYKDGCHITAATGLAAMQLNGTTLHSWAGVGFGKGSNKELYDKVLSSGMAIKRQKTTKILMLDEISMISGELFDALEYIGRKIRTKFSQKEKPFGGIQLIFCGDFLQLPPVKSKFLAFEAKSQSNCFPKQSIFELTEVFRQRDPYLISILSQLRQGKITPSIERTLRQTVQNRQRHATQIFSHRKKVAEVNTISLNKLPGRVFHFRSYDKNKQIKKAIIDEQASRYIFSQCLAPTNLSLKIGAQVILVKNINPEEGLVNGLRGIVRGFTLPDQNSISKDITFKKLRKMQLKGEKVPLVEFPSISKRSLIYRYKFSINDGNGKVKFVRKQIPLDLAWALTIHKCQGMTLDNAVMDLNYVWEPGHFYVAVSRIRNLKGLQIIGNFNRSCIRADSKVLSQMNKNGLLNDSETKTISNSKIENKNASNNYNTTTNDFKIESKLESKTLSSISPKTLVCNNSLKENKNFRLDKHDLEIFQSIDLDAIILNNSKLQQKESKVP